MADPGRNPRTVVREIHSGWEKAARNYRAGKSGAKALGLQIGRDPLTLVQLGLESKKYYLIKLKIPQRTTQGL